MDSVGFWKSKNGYITHQQGLREEDLVVFRNLQVGDRLVLFVNDIREGERKPHLTLKRSIFKGENNANKG